jgi:hypothetical protein
VPTVNVTISEIDVKVGSSVAVASGRSVTKWIFDTSGVHVGASTVADPAQP